MGDYYSNHAARVARAQAEMEAYYAAHPEMRMDHVAPMDINRLMPWNYMPGGMYYGGANPQEASATATPSPTAPQMTSIEPSGRIHGGRHNYGVHALDDLGWGAGALSRPQDGPADPSTGLPLASAAPTVAPPSAAAPQVAPATAAPRTGGIRSAIAAADPSNASASPASDLLASSAVAAPGQYVLDGVAQAFSKAPKVGTPGAGVPAITDASSKAPMDGLVQKKDDGSGMSPFLGGGVMDIMAKKGMNPYQGLFGFLSQPMFGKGGLLGGMFNI